MTARTCPMCAEDIAAQDAVCPHCEHVLVAPPRNAFPGLPTTPGTPSRRRRSFGALGAGALVMILGVSVFVWVQRRSPESTAPSRSESDTEAHVRTTAQPPQRPTEPASPAAPPRAEPAPPSPLPAAPTPPSGPIAQPAEPAAPAGGSVMPVANTPTPPARCVTSAQDSFHLRATETTRSRGAAYPRGTRLEVLGPGSLTRGRNTIYHVRLLDDGAEGWMFLGPGELVACGGGAPSEAPSSGELAPVPPPCIAQCMAAHREPYLRCVDECMHDGQRAYECNQDCGGEYHQCVGTRCGIDEGDTPWFRPDVRTASASQ